MPSPQPARSTRQEASSLGLWPRTLESHWRFAGKLEPAPQVWRAALNIDLERRPLDYQQPWLRRRPSLWVAVWDRLAAEGGEEQARCRQGQTPWRGLAWAGQISPAARHTGEILRLR